MDDDAAVFKLIGPALIKQDLVEAKVNVGKRLEYIQGELTRLTDKQAGLEARARDQQALVRACRACLIHCLALPPARFGGAVRGGVGGVGDLLSVTWVGSRGAAASSAAAPLLPAVPHPPYCCR